MANKVWYCTRIMKGKDIQRMVRNAKANLSTQKETASGRLAVSKNIAI